MDARRRLAAVPLAFAFLLAAAPQAPPGAPEPRKIEIDLDKAVAIDLPAPKEDLAAAAFRTPDGKDGWLVRIPGGRPIATPAYAEGRIFVGGGYGSHEFYAFDAATGRLAWQMKTADDGPTAAVVEDGCVAFNTESCTVVVADAKDGKVIWQEWLGDPLMSQPAIADGRLYIAYPGGQRPHGPGAGANAAPNAGGGPAANLPPGHRLLCADLKTGRHLWEAPITGDVISAPVLDEGKAYFTCFDGTSFCLDAREGKEVWKRHNAGTSAPIVVQDQVVVTERRDRAGRREEGIRRLDPAKGEEKDKELLVASAADHLGEGKGGGVAITLPQLEALESSVGFGGGAPVSAGMAGASANVGVYTVAGAWAYQGSRAAYRDGQVMNAQGNVLNCLSAESGRLGWQARAKGQGISEGTQVFSPPALGSKNLYLCSAQGHLAAIGQKEGALAFLYATKVPMVFQPALAGGNLYAGTSNGMLVCLKTGDPDADGWYAWGGNARHNKKD